MCKIGWLMNSAIRYRWPQNPKLQKPIISESTFNSTREALSQARQWKRVSPMNNYFIVEAE